MPLYGNDIDETTDPFEAGLGFAVKLDKTVAFLGQESLRARKERGPSRKLVGFRMLGRRVARQGMKVHRAGAPAESAGPGEEVGIITSGVPSPTLGYPVAMGYVAAAVAAKDPSGLVVDVRGHLEPIQIEALPFYSRTRKKGK
jgi:aminomethyltransferase